MNSRDITENKKLQKTRTLTVLRASYSGIHGFKSVLFLGRLEFFLNGNLKMQRFFYLINSVVVTNKMDKLRVTAASKQNGLKWAVAQDINSRRKEGRQVVRSSLVSRRLNTISIFNPFDGESMGNNFKCTILSKVCSSFIFMHTNCGYQKKWLKLD